MEDVIAIGAGVVGCAVARELSRYNSELKVPFRRNGSLVLVRVAGIRKPLPVKTKAPVPKAKIDAVLFALHQTTVQLPVQIGDVIVPNVAETGIDVVATANL